MKLIHKYGAPLFVIGSPVEHTFSPYIHNRAFEAAGLEHRYFALQVEKGELEQFIDLCEQLQSPGANLTLPHKETICSAIPNKNSEVERLQAANTIYRRHGELRLANTDLFGFRRLIEPWVEKIRDEGVLLLGAGGAARACLLGFEQENCKKIFLWNRTTRKALELQEEFPELQLEVLDQKQLNNGEFSASVVVNATSVGLKADEPVLVPKAVIRSDMVGIDLIYNRETRFVKSFKRLGSEATGGLDMLVHQAARSWELWTDQQAPTKAMFAAVGGLLSGI